MVQDRDPQLGVLDRSQDLRRALELRLGDETRLVSPGTDGVQSDGEDALAAVDGLGRPPVALELGIRAGEAGGKRVRDVVVPRHDQERPSEAVQEGRRRLVLGRLPTVREVAAGDHELRLEAVDERCERPFHGRRFRRADMQIRDMQDPCKHRRSRLYTRNVTDESTELFDDLYLGLRAGGAARKRRRGEPLTADELEALGRWRRLSTWRKAVAIGGVAGGALRLGGALGRLPFRRWVDAFV